MNLSKSSSCHTVTFPASKYNGNLTRRVHIKKEFSKKVMDQMHAMFEGHMDQFGYPPDAFLLGPHEYLAFKVEMYEDGQKTLESFAQYAQEYYIKVPVLISTRAGVDIVIHPEYVEQFTISSV